MKVIVFLLSLICPICVFAEPIRVGVSVTLTGEAASFGQDMKNAIILAKDDIGASKFDPDGAVNGINFELFATKKGKPVPIEKPEGIRD